MIHRITTLLVLAILSASVFGQETQRQYLSGKGIDDVVQWEFFCTAGNKSGSWTTIPVPSCWDVEGFGSLTYGRGDPVSNEQGKYKHRFTVPANWSGQTISLVFEGSMTDTEATINGQSAGPVHQGSYYRFKYDVTDKVKLGAENLLEVTVSKESENQSVNRAERRADYWNYGGIFRPVYLEARPKQNIDRVAIDAKADGTFAMDVYTSGATAADMVQAKVMDLNGNQVGAPIQQKLVDGKVRLTGKFDAPKQWTAETPNLYQVEVLLAQDFGNPAHRIKQKFGFRTIEVKAGDGVYVNGQRIILKGTNRHSFWPDTGRATSERLSRLDVQVMKEMNNNAVRMSHYPPDEHFLEVCDEMGLYVLDELAGWHAAYDTPTGTRLIEAMIKRDVNHPSILFWDNGNEGGWNTAVDDEFGKWDPQQRHVLHPWDPFRDMDTKHYLDFNQTRTRANGPMVFMPTEFLHAMFDGGGAAGLEEYWEPMRTGKVAAGGFIWAFADETVKRKDLGGTLDPHKNDAPDGVVGPYREKEGSFYAIKEIWSPVVVKRDASGGFSIENRYDFTNTDQCTITWQVRSFKGPADQAAGFTVLKEGKVSVSIPPHASGPLKLPIQLPQSKLDDVVAIRIDDPAGRELWTYVSEINHGDPAQAQVATRIDTPPSNQKVTEDAQSITLTAADVTAVFNKQTGYLTSVTRGTKSFSLTNGPRLAVGSATVAAIEKLPNGIAITYTGDMKSTRWTIQPDGSLILAYAYSLSGPHDFFGVSFDYPEANVKKMKWLGNGPFRVWKNRLRGGTLNVWENTFNNTMTGYSGFVYPEFKGFYSDVRWMQLETTEGNILMTLDDPSAFVQVLKVQYPGDPKPGQNANNNLSGNAWGNMADSGIAILNGISAVGSKFRTPESTGPAGQKAVANGDYRGTVRFNFGASK